MQDFYEEQFQQAYDGTFNLMKERRRTDPDFSIQRLRELLDTYYVNEGNNWVGRGESAQNKIAASIAAMEEMLAEWERELEAVGETKLARLA